MIMKRIVAAFEKKVEAVKAERKMKRIMRCVEIAKDNSLDEIDKLAIKKGELVETLPDVEDYDDFIQELSNLMDAEDEQKAILTRLDEIMAYLDEEIEVVKEKK